MARHGRDWRYCAPWKQSLVWDGRRWAVDEKLATVGLVKETQAAFYRDVLGALAELDVGGNTAADLGLARELEGDLKHALAWEDAKAISRCLELARSKPGILAWAVRGCLEWQAQGLGEPEEVRAATATYQAEQDTAAGFIRECCLVHREAKAAASALFEAYITWLGDKLMTLKAFGQRMTEKGFERVGGHGGRVLYRGIGLPVAVPTPSVKDGEGSSG